jgi:hypothetical protein
MTLKIPIWIRVAAALLTLCAAGPPGFSGGPPEETQRQGPSSRDVWSALIQRRPYPYRIPLPEPARSPADGTYTKVVATAAERVHCLRCPDYAPEGGLWKLNLNQGTFRVLHPESRWKSIGTYIVAGDRILLANDPACQDELGLYRWRLQEGELVFEVIDDPCAIKLRAVNLTQQPWRPCRPPNIEAAVTGHWPKPDGCDDAPNH